MRTKGQVVNGRGTLVKQREPARPSQQLVNNQRGLREAHIINPPREEGGTPTYTGVIMGGPRIVYGGSHIHRKPKPRKKGRKSAKRYIEPVYEEYVDYEEGEYLDDKEVAYAESVEYLESKFGWFLVIMLPIVVIYKIMTGTF